jgi:arylsulfatase A-like enzyme
VLPQHSGIDFFVQLEPDTALNIARISSWGEATSPALEVAVQGTDAENEKVVRVESPFGRGEPVSLPLDISTPQIARISLRVVSAGEEEHRAAGLRLVAPALTAKQHDVAFQARAVAPTEDEDRREVQTRPNVVLYIIDTLRADHLGCYGYARPTSPRIDRFADGATRFARASAQSAWTKPAVASILTGLYPPVHGANSVSEVLTDQIPTLAEALADSGYDTAGFVTNSVLSRDYGFDQGFHHFEYLKETEDREFHQLSDRVNQSVFSWLDNRPGEKPFFICVHTMDPHAPYTPRSPFAEEFASQVRDPRVGLLPNVNGLTWKDRNPDKHTAEELIALYDGEVKFNDAQFGELLDKLEALNQLESSLVVLVSDHGEEFGDHGRWQHGFTLFEEMLHVPLVIKFPFGEGAGAVVDSAVGQVDIVPTVLEGAGLTVPAGVHGRNLAPLIDATNERRDSTPLFSYIKKQRWRDVASVTAADRKLVWYKIYDSPRPQIELYDLARDPGEKDDLARREPVLAGYFMSVLKDVELSWAGRAPTEESVMSEEMEERLRALGYLQ